MIIDKFPNNLYKYRQLNDHSKLLLTDNAIYFASPSEFNDPFDCNIPYRYDLGTKASIVQFYYKHLKEENHTMKDSDIRKNAKDLYKSKQHKDLSVIKQRNKTTIDYIKNSIGIFSLTPDYKNLLMWSHYANSHTGFCVCFNVKLLLTYFMWLYEKHKQNNALFKVKYSPEYPILDPFKIVDIEKISNILTKAEVWSYEDEYRLILLNGAKRVATLPNGVIKRVILGCQINNNDKQEIIAILKKKKENIYLYQSKLLENKYGLGFEQIHYQ